MAYTGNITIGGYELTVNPSQIKHSWIEMGSSERTIGGKAIRQFVSPRKLSVSITGVNQSEYDQIKKYIAAEYNVSYVDHIPITERGEQTREVFENISLDTINGQIIYTYVPRYYVDIVAAPVTYEANAATWELTLEEI